MITDNSGNVVSRHDYMAFGEEVPRANYGSDSIRDKYTGYERDNESGLDYAQARYYSSSTGRFTSVDPLMASATIKNPQTFNRYIYALNSPYKFIDPLGLVATSTECGNQGQPTCAQADDQNAKNKAVVPPKDLIDDVRKDERSGTVNSEVVIVQVPDNLKQALEKFAIEVYQGNFSFTVRELSDKKNGRTATQTITQTDGGSSTTSKSSEESGEVGANGTTPSIKSGGKEGESSSTTGNGSISVSTTVNYMEAEVNAFDVDIATEANNIVNTFTGTNVTYIRDKDGVYSNGPLLNEFVRQVVNEVKFRATVRGLTDALDAFSPPPQPKKK